MNLKKFTFENTRNWFQNYILRQVVVLQLVTEQLYYNGTFIAENLLKSSKVFIEKPVWYKRRIVWENVGQFAKTKNQPTKCYFIYSCKHFISKPLHSCENERTKRTFWCESNKNFISTNFIEKQFSRTDCQTDWAVPRYALCVCQKVSFVRFRSNDSVFINFVRL